MSQTVITAHINDQTIQMVNTTTIASGSTGVLQIQCDFDSRWDGYTKTAVFYRDEAQVYHVKMTDDLATVPHEVMADKGSFFFGIMGVGENTRTTEVLRITVVKGALTTPTANHEELTPDIYHQLLAAYGQLDSALAKEKENRETEIAKETASRKAEIAVERARLDNLVAMRSDSGETVYEFSTENLSVTITTNGIDAYVDVVVNGEFESGQSVYCDIPDFLSPLGERVCIEDGTYGTAFAYYSKIRYWVLGGESFNGTEHLSGTYPLKYPTINEITDARVGYDGTQYPNAGKAVRGQVADINKAFEEVMSEKNILDPSNSENANRSLNASMTVTQNDNRRQTVTPIPVDRTKSLYLYLRTSIKSDESSYAIQILWLDANGKYLGNFSTRFSAVIKAESGCLRTDSIPVDCTQMHVQTTGAKTENGDHTLDKVCISYEPLDAFEDFKRRVLRPSAMPDRVAPTAGLKMLVFGDSITETANMNANGGNYNPDYRMNWPVVAKQMLQLDSIRNYAKSGATCRDTGYERNEQGDLVPKDDTVVYRKNLSEQIDLALSDTNYTDTPDIIVISIGTNDSVAIADKPDDSRDTYEDAMGVPTLKDFTYETRTTMHKALRYAMWKLKNRFPYAKCFIATPLQRGAFEIPLYTREAIISMANRYGFKVIDAYAESGIIHENEITEKDENGNIIKPGAFLPDGLHPSSDAGINMEGVTRLAALYANVILSTYLHEEYAPKEGAV